MPQTETRSSRWAALALPVLCFALPTAGAQSSEYLNFADLSTELRAAVDGSPRANLRSLGQSREGREIWIVEIAEPGGPPVGERPGVLVVGNLSGDHLVGSQLALETVRFLVGDQATEADLGQHVIYVVPRLNPDGAEAMFNDARDGHRLNALPFDADNDGRLDEDGPDDLNGDGEITQPSLQDSADLNEATSSQRSHDHGPSTVSRRRRLWVFRLIALLLIPALFFLVLEIGLRAVGTGYRAAFLVPVADNPGVVADNFRFAWRFFPRALARSPQPILVTKDKPPGTKRVIVFGGSAVGQAIRATGHA